MQNILKGVAQIEGLNNCPVDMVQSTAKSMDSLNLVHGTQEGWRSDCQRPVINLKYLNRFVKLM